jgi:hypothetical protein
MGSHFENQVAEKCQTESYSCEIQETEFIEVPCIKIHGPEVLMNFLPSSPEFTFLCVGGRGGELPTTAHIQSPILEEAVKLVSAVTILSQ